MLSFTFERVRLKLEIVVRLSRTVTLSGLQIKTVPPQVLANGISAVVFQDGQGRKEDAQVELDVTV